MRCFLVTAIVLTIAAASPTGAGALSGVVALKTLPVLDAGRVKPLDTFAREFALEVTGSESCAGMDHMELFLLFLLNPEKAAREPLVYVRSALLREELGLPAGETRFAAFDLLRNSRFKSALRTVANSPRQRMLFDEAFDLLRLLTRLENIKKELRAVPPPPGGREWRPLEDVVDAGEPSLKRVQAAFNAMASACVAHQEREFSSAADEFVSALRAVNPDARPNETVLSLEVFDNEIRPFQKAWILYFVGFAASVLLLFLAKGRIRLIALVPAVAGLLLHTGGLCLRAIIAGRVPLGDMYESVVFMGWGAMVLGLILGAIYRRGLFAVIAVLVAGVSLLLADYLPGGAGLQPLPLVISNSTWLTVHVATIVLGYSAFSLAAGLAHYGWGVYCFAPQKELLFKSVSNFVYRVVQVGVVFLIAGTAMGGAWANESWGRFWGWDPKETWAMITILVYMIILHARRCGRLREFGLVIGAISGFLVVLMTWYGVNYLLGTGLHSYGFGAGGRALVLPAVAAEFIIIFTGISVRSARVAVSEMKPSTGS